MQGLSVQSTTKGGGGMKKKTIFILIGMMVMVAATVFAGNDAQFDQKIIYVASVPEPASLILMATGALGLIGLRRKKRNR